MTDNSPSWRPESYQSTVWEQPIIQFYFYTNKLLDYRGKELILEENRNPFAWVVLVQLVAIKTKHDPNNRLQQKFILTHYLYKCGYTQEGISALLLFMDWILILPEPLEIRYNKEIKQFEEEHGMSYVTSFERHGIQQGIQQGMQQGIRQGEYVMLQRQLQRKFNQVPSHYLDKIQKADPETLLKWGESVLDAKNIEEVFVE